ncbi:hypothetical protein [Chamaesiphon minutus]|uniref:Uncharacterized protein n=1 Tax=Chamaesiphon minutus (strain ATCC 27169 / PCC 6605) TaxID=1173020 RepID=K9UE94_CHAP6|nr:hypothetical protein [Chamaesiphon minutus]AFY93150.1 hypothetical protein Cha6605_2055 [Chamaesiphon minutus PCC 6605]
MITTPIFTRQPPHIRSCTSLKSFRNILKIDYYPSLNRWESHLIFNRDGKVCQQFVIVCIHSCEGESTFEWCRPDLDVIISGGRKEVIDRLLKEDILKYLIPTFN